MPLFEKNKKNTSSAVKKVRPTVVQTENVAKEIAAIAKENGVTPESLDFNLLDVRTYTRINKDGKEGEWEEVAKETLHDISRDTLLDPDFQIKQNYEIEVFTRMARNKDPLPDFKIAIGANATKCKVYMQIKPGSVLKYFTALKEELRIFINKHKIRAGILIYIFDEMLEDVLSKIVAKVQVDEIVTYEKTETYLIAQSIEPTQTINGSVIYHYKEEMHEEDEDGRIDYSNRGYIQSVHKDQLLIEYLKPKAGQPGRDCRGHYIAPKEPQEVEDLGFNIDEETIYMTEDETSIKFFAKENGYISFEDNTYTIKSEADVNQVSFKTTGSIMVGTDSEVNVVVTEKDAVKDAIGVGMVVEATEVEVEGNVGDEATVKAITATIGGLTHRTALIEADEIDINVHKGTARGKKVKIKRLEHGVVEGEEIHIEQAMGGKVYGENVIIDICTSYVRVNASHKIEIKRMRGSENIFTIDPLQQRTTKESYEKNKEEIEKLNAELRKLKKMVQTQKSIVEKNLPILNDIKKKLLHYKKNKIKLPEAYVKQYKVYQAQVDKFKSMKMELSKIEEKLQLLSNQRGSLQYNIRDARVINKDVWRDYNEIRAKLIDPPIEIVYKPRDNEPGNTYGVVEVEEGEFEIRPLNGK
ncbi:MAG: DUF342 domain-containing protein [Epsilonproteobacteria bacterium]|nr:DUF342 domain-containing protein [Campylobacterota bacterium]